MLAACDMRAEMTIRLFGDDKCETPWTGVEGVEIKSNGYEENVFKNVKSCD